MFDQNQVPKWACIRDDNHADRRSTIRLGRQFILALLPEPGAGLAFTLEVPEGVLQRHAVMLEEAVQLVPRRELQQLTELVAGNPVHSVGVDCERLQRGPRQILALLGELLDEIVRQIKPDAHAPSVGQRDGSAHTTTPTLGLDSMPAPAPCAPDGNQPDSSSSRRSARALPDLAHL